MKLAGVVGITAILVLIYGIMYFMADEAGRKALSVPFKILFGWIKPAIKAYLAKRRERQKVDVTNPRWPGIVLAFAGIVFLVGVYFGVGALYRVGGRIAHSIATSSIEGPYNVPLDVLPGIANNMFTNYGTIQKTAEDGTNWQIFPEKHWWGVSYKYYEVRENGRLVYAGKVWLYNGGKYYTSDGVKTFVAGENNWVFK